MSIQSFAEKLLAVMDEAYAKEANNLTNAARQRTGNESYVVGCMDGLHSASGMIKETYKLFVKSESEVEDESKPLY